jgi:hypothetical protein
MIRLQTDRLFERAIERHDEYLLPLADLIGPLRDHGIDIASAEGDVALIDLREQAGPFDRPTIVFDRHDGGFLWGRSGPGDGESRRLLCDPMVVGQLKIARYRSLEDYDSPPTDRALHARVIQRYHADADPLGNETVAPAISPSGYHKIRLMPGFWAFEQCCPVAETTIDLHAPRQLDVYCAATIQYDCRAVVWHRRRALDVLATLRHARVMLARGRLMPVPVYHRLLLDSKICVSPWGYGETCHRDYEALLAGCILIKPRTDFSESLLPLDEGRHYFACRPDFEDLPDLIGSILSQWTRLVEHRRECRQYVLDGRRLDWLADRVADELSSVIGNLA